MSVPLSPQDVLGVPVLPPPRATFTVSRLRDALLRLHRRLAPPPLQVLESLFGLLDHRVLVSLCDAGVPDALTRRMTVDELARTVGAETPTLERLVRYAATRGWVRIDRRGRVQPTPVTAFLRRNHPGGWRAWVDFAGGSEVVAAVQQLSVACDEDPFAAANGMPFFDWLAARPERGAAFDNAMAAGARMHALTLAKGLRWPTPSSVCDVGGGTGDLLAALLDRVPGLTGTVLDLPPVIARAVAHDRMSAVPGDAFESVPAGFDTYLLVNVVHDWADDDVVLLLAGVADAATPASRVVVVEAEATHRPLAGVPVAADVLMATLTPGGRERTSADIEALAEQAGLRIAARTRLASGDIAWTLSKQPAPCHG